MIVRSNASLASAAAGPSQNQWASASRLALWNALFFFVVSSINFVLEVSTSFVHIVVASFFFLGSVCAFYRMIVTGGALAAISFYVLGAGLVFGFGSAYSTTSDNPVFAMMFGEEQQARDFAAINLMNSLSVVIVLASAFLICGTRYEGSPQQGLREIIGALQTLRRPVVMFAVLALVLHFSSFQFQRICS